MAINKVHVIIIGGSVAGLSAALALGRALQAWAQAVASGNLAGGAVNHEISVDEFG